VWKDIDSRIQPILQDLERHKRLLAEQVPLMIYNQNRNHSQQLDGLSQDVNRNHDELRTLIQNSLNERQQSFEEADRNRIRNQLEKLGRVHSWMDAAHMSKYQSDYLMLRHAKAPGSGKWIMNHDKMRDWKDNDPPESSVLWMYGQMGAGI